MSTRQRVTGKLGDRMVNAALDALERPGFFHHSGNYGIKQPLDMWRSAMRRSLEAAFDELLKEPEPLQRARESEG